MAKLIVEARGTVARADPGGEVRAAIVVSVTDEVGKPVTTLGAANFGVDAIVVAADAPSLTISALISRTAGVYLLDIVPAAEGRDWRPGHHVLAVAVASGFSRGQCLTELTIP